MKSTSSSLVRENLFQILTECRCKTLKLFEAIDEEKFYKQAHPDFSPAGWHLGHIGLTEAYWILEKCGGKPTLFPEFVKLFAADGLPKAQRQNLPSLEEVKNYLATIRKQVLAYLITAPLEKQERLWRWLIQHESQHSETITFVLKLQQEKLFASLIAKNQPLISFEEKQMSEIPAGWFVMGNDGIEAQDNEKPAHQVYLEKYYIDKYPVTCFEYRKFIEAGGYDRAEFWTNQGWKWLKVSGVKQPQFWVDDEQWDNHPVCGVSCHEAEAYASFVGKRLPSEAEWEKAALASFPFNHDTLFGQTTPVTDPSEIPSLYGCYSMLGNVWEWTQSCFEGYLNFESYPYEGYSQVYFDGQHRVLKGGSWATRPWALRVSFRNWYHPDVRQIFAGFRCATSY